jgi:putative PIN family toxin of toxin-antitoxin system
MKVVLDTNIIVSALLSPQGLPAKILNLVLEASLTIAYDNTILAEYIDVLSRDKLKIHQELKEILIDFIAKEGSYTIAKPQKIKFDDEDDKIFYEVYKSSGENYLITGNKKHFPKEKNIVSAREFLEMEYDEE